MKKAVLIGVPHHNNLGDHAIVLAEREYIENNFKEYQYYEVSEETAEKCLENDIDVMIDDSARICRECFQKNITTLIKDKPSNRDETEIARVHNWKEIYEFITNYKKEKVNVILDTETYNECDDQFALAYLLKNQYKFNIEAITVAPYSHQSRNVSVREGQELSYNEILKI